MDKISENIFSRIDRFIRKHQQLIFIKGTINLLFYSSSLIAVIVLLEHFFWLKPEIKTIIYYLFLSLFIFGIVVFGIIPLLRLLRVLKSISQKEAVYTISNYFPNINDRLINAYELAKEEDVNNPLFEASIKQKSKYFDDYDFNKALDIVPLKQSAFRLLSVLLLCVLMLSAFNSDSLSAINRLANYQEEFIPPPSFKMTLENQSLEVKKGDDYHVKVRVEGKEIPGLVYIKINGQNFLMKAHSDSIFSYQLKNITRNLSFSFTDGNIHSELYRLKVLPVPEITSFQVHSIPPLYTRFPEINQKNDGNLTVPQGSVVRWDFKTIATDSLALCFINDTLHLNIENETFTGGLKLLEGEEYSVWTRNKYFSQANQLRYQINVIPDLFPEIKISEVKDSLNFALVYFRGIIKDDYGFSKLQMVVSIDNDSVFSLPFQKNITQQEFYYLMDFSLFKEAGNTISYFFEVWDNDEINGPKRTSSPTYIFHFPTENELRQQESESLNKMEDALTESMEISQKLQEKLQEIKEKSIKGEVSEWEKRQMVEDVVSQKQALESILNKVSEEFQNNNHLQNSFTEQEKNILEKQQQVQELLDQVLSDELKKLLDEFNDLAQNFDEKKFNDLTREIDFSMDDLSRQLDRNLEMLRKMQVERSIENIANQLKSLAEKELEESESIKSTEEGLTRNRENRAEFKQLMEQFNNIKEKNKELKHPFQIEEFQEERENINNSFNNTEQFFQHGRKNKGSKGMKQNSGAKQNLASKMHGMMQSNLMQMQAENIESLEQLLHNLIQFSFQEEEIMDNFRFVSADDPQFRKLSRRQNVYKEQWLIIRDSLYVLAEKSTVLSQDINKEIVNINTHITKVEEFLPESGINQARGSLQYIMTSANNLALLLEHVLNAAKNAMRNAMLGDGEGEGNKGKGMPGLKNSMEAFQKQLQQMIQQLKFGQGQPSANDFGKMLRQQEMLQKMMQKLMESGQVGGDAFKKLSEIQKMLEQTRKELVNQNVSVRTLERQHQIRTRLLEAESAQMERDKDNKRESETAKKLFYSNPAIQFEKVKKIYNFNENLNEYNIPLNQFYDQKYLDYIEKLQIPEK